MRGAILLLLFLSTGTCKVLISVSIKSKGDSLDPAALSAGGYGLQNVTETEVLSVEPLVAAEAWVNLTGSRAALDPSAVSGLPAALPPLLPDGASLQPVLTLDRVAVRECARGTFSPDFGGECRNCTAACEAESYVRSACTSSRDLVCMECAVCGPTDLELCPCGPVSDACFIGNRVCLRVAPTDVTLKIGLAAVTFLTEEQLAQVQASLNTTFAEWLGAAFGSPVSMSGYTALSIDTTYLFVQFLAAGLYNRTTIARLRQVDQAYMQEGVLATLGQGARRRRLLQAFLTVKQTSAACQVQTIECPAFTAFTAANCTGTCQPTPCPVGYTGGLGQCEPCATSGYKDTNGSAACTPCPANSLTQAQAATSRGQCLCLAGFYSDAAQGVCARCQVANFCPGGGVQQQVRCPLQKFAPAGSASADQCVCPTRASVPAGGSACACPDSDSLRVEISPPDPETGATFRCDLCPPRRDVRPWSVHPLHHRCGPADHDCSSGCHHRSAEGKHHQQRQYRHKYYYYYARRRCHAHPHPGGVGAAARVPRHGEVRSNGGARALWGHGRCGAHGHGVRLHAKAEGQEEAQAQAARPEQEGPGV